MSDAEVLRAAIEYIRDATTRADGSPRYDQTAAAERYDLASPLRHRLLASADRLRRGLGQVTRRDVLLLVEAAAIGDAPPYLAGPYARGAGPPPLARPVAAC